MFNLSIFIWKGLSIKDVRTKLQKLIPLPPCAQNVRTASTPPIRAGTTANSPPVKMVTAFQLQGYQVTHNLF